ncbi:MAG: alpha/beta hydrolase [Dehalococcoidia bacterium]|nr:MAG: alpha/beta hydrolase [Dehalococcoidia bacterium]
MPFANSQGTRIYYERHGPKPGSTPAIVFVHGAGGNHLSWWQQLPHFLGRYTCVAYDQRGYGQSRDDDGGRGGAAFVDDLRAVMDDAGVERATLVAQSLGGWACLGFTRRWPERVERLAMCDTHGGLESPELRTLWSSTLALAAALPEGVHPACGQRMHREQPELHFLYVAISELNARSQRQMLEDIRNAGPTALDEAGRIETPVLFIEGAEDIVILPSMIELAAAAFPRARVQAVAEAGHSVYFERPAEFNAILDKFLAE